MNKKIVVVILVIAFVLSGASFVDAANSTSLPISITNSLPLPVYKKVDISIGIPNLKKDDKVAVFLKGKEIPIQVINRSATSLRFSTVLSFAPHETKILILKHGKDIIPNKNQIFYKTNFSGTYFVGIGSGKLFIISLSDNNDVSVKSNNGDVLFSGILNKKEFKTVSLPRDQVFTIQSKAPIFAEVSSLKRNCLQNSSDDVSSVYGTYFLLFIPREIVVSSYSSTKLVIKSLSGNVVYSGTLPPRGQYKNFSLTSGVYEISADHPVTVQFGCEDDNIYAINYGAPNEFKGVSYGNVVCSALFSNTKVQIKTPSKTFAPVNLESPGDYIYKILITEYKDSYTETMPVFIRYSKPVLIYSDSNHGNIGGEQIPSLFGHKEHYIFLTGKIFNFNGLIHKRKVVIIPTLPDTTIILNGKKYTLKGALMPKTFLFGKSYTAIKIDSNKPISVFDVGITTSIEFLSMLLPFKDNSVSYTIGNISPKTSGQNGSGVVPESGQNTLLKYVTPIVGFFATVWNSIEKTSIYKSTSDTLSQFWKAISPSLNSLSKQIIALFIPVAQMVYPYVHPYFSSLTISELAAILFYLLIALVIILLIPKRRKKPIPVEKVTEAELKKKGNVAFNVKTIEEKGMSGIKAAPTGKPKMLVPKYAKKSEETASNKSKMVKVERKSITLGTSKSKEKAATTKPLGKPLQIFKHSTKVESAEKPEEKPLERLNTRGPLPIKEKTASLEKSAENAPLEHTSAKAESSSKGIDRLKGEAALKKILNKSTALSQKENVTEQPLEEKEVLIKGKSLSETKSPEAAIESERIAEVLKKLKETTTKVSEQSKELKGAGKGKTIGKPTQSEVTSVQSANKPEAVKPEAVKSKKESTKESTIEERKTVEKQEKSENISRKAFGIDKLFGRKAVKVSKSTESKEQPSVPAANKEEISEQSLRVGELAGEKKEAIEELKSVVKEEPGKVSNIPPKGETVQKKEGAKEEIHSSLSELIEKVRKEPQLKKTTEIPVNEEIVSKIGPTEKVEQPTGISISGSAALDSRALSVLYKLHALEHLSRIMISAKDQPNVDPDIKTKYRISIISLTGIELRIAEDLARRIGAKKSTGELLLIAKKTRINKIIVDDQPKITNYQGIKIININDLTNQK